MVGEADDGRALAYGQQDIFLDARDGHEHSGAPIRIGPLHGNILSNYAHRITLFVMACWPVVLISALDRAWRWRTVPQHLATSRLAVKLSIK